MPRYTEQEARTAIEASFSYAETLRRLDLRTTGGNWLTLQRWAERWGISTEHFDRNASSTALMRARARPLAEILVAGSPYSRSSLKRRLWAEGLKPRLCGLCGQGELWRGRPLGLILDHLNGVRDDNRLENLRIVCPNCAATLDTHCGRKNRREVTRACERCGFTRIAPASATAPAPAGCGTSARASPTRACRRAERPPHDQLLREIAATSDSAVGRRYGVSDNAIRKWVRQYEREAAAAVSAATGRAPSPGAAAPPSPTTRGP
ncbi:MAG: HNH endonuclease [Solirubrobacteraceae bacterium]|nr:HNH endonuclease [Solirubrobacteraceae bacterium]